jgi:RNA polymerase sigma-70 factor, ECF subfamily
MIDVVAHISSLKRYAMALTRSPDRADDLVQDTLARAIAKQHLFEPGTDLGAWLRTMLHRRHVDKTRRAVREGVHVSADGLVDLPCAAAQYPHMLLREVLSAMDKLPADQRKTLVCLSQGHSREDVARQMGVPLDTVRSRAALARRALKARLTA